MAFISTVAGAGGTTTTQYPEQVPSSYFMSGIREEKVCGPMCYVQNYAVLTKTGKYRSSRDVISPVDNDSTLKHGKKKLEIGVCLCVFFLFSEADLCRNCWIFSIIVLNFRLQTPIQGVKPLGSPDRNPARVHLVVLESLCILRYGSKRRIIRKSKFPLVFPLHIRPRNVLKSSELLP